MFFSGAGCPCAIPTTWKHADWRHGFMNHFTRFAGWLIAAFGACSLIVYGAIKLTGRIYLSSGLGELPPLISPQIVFASFASVTVGCFLILWFCANKSGLKISTLHVVCIGIIAALFGICSWSLNKPPPQNFLDGLTARVSANINENEATSWADQIFADDKSARTDLSVVRLPQDKVPAFFSSVFSGATPSAVVSYSPTGRPICIHVFVGGGFERWGLAIFNTNSSPNNEVMVYRQCGKRLFAFHSSH
jgi:hypothetical protein